MNGSCPQFAQACVYPVGQLGGLCHLEEFLFRIFCSVVVLVLALLVEVQPYMLDISARYMMGIIRGSNIRQSGCVSTMVDYKVIEAVLDGLAQALSYGMNENCSL